MSERLPFWRLRRWIDAWRPDADLAEAEGLAAGTGLLTGEVARDNCAGTEDRACPSCGGRCEVVVVDLVTRSTTRKCRSCARRWTTDDLEATPTPHQVDDRRLH